MINENIRNDYDQIVPVIQRVRDHAKEIKKILDACDEAIEQNVGDNKPWAGERATTFKNTFKKQAATFDSFVEMVNREAGNIETASTAYKKFDQA